jgi:beta-glucanase (GH16 family)
MQTSAWILAMYVGTQTVSNSTEKVFDFDPREDFHVYAMEWNSSLLTWWVDDVQVKQEPSAPYFNQGWPMDIALSLGVRQPLDEHPNATSFPTTFYVGKSTPNRLPFSFLLRCARACD